MSCHPSFHPFSPLPLPFSAMIAQLPHQVAAQGSPRRGVRSTEQHGVLDQVFNPDPPLVGSVLRRQFLLQRRERGASFFHLCVSWEMLACVYPRVQFEKLHVVGASSKNPCCLCLLLIWKAQFSNLVLVLRKKNIALSVTMTISFGTNRVQYVAASRSLTRDCTWVAKSRRSRSTSPATSALPGNLASNFGAPGQPRVLILNILQF